MADRFQFNMAGLIDLSNDVLEADCIPIAEDILSTAQTTAAVRAFDTGDYHDSIHLEVDRRTGADDFAHARVVADDWKASIIESRENILGSAAANAGGAL